MSVSTGQADRVPQLFVIVASLDVGGTERHLFQVLPRLVEAGFGVTVGTLHRRGSLADDMEASGIRVLTPRIPAWISASRVLRAIAVTVWYGITFRRLAPDIVHTFSPEAYVCAGLASVVAGVPARVMSRRCLDRYQQQYPFAARIERLLHRRMSMLVANSRAVEKQLRAEAGLPRDRIALIYNGIDLAPFDAARSRLQTREALGVPVETLVITVIANLIAYKGHSDLLIALGAIKQDLPPGWVLLLVGRDGGVEGQLRRQAKELGIADNIRWLGGRAEVPDILAASDLGVLSSHEEGFPNAVLEGQAARVPMIVTDVGGSPEAIADGCTGLVVPARDPAALAEALLKLAGDAPRRASMGRRGRAWIVERFSLDACVEQYTQLYNRLLAQNQALRVARRNSHNSKDEPAT